MVETVIREPLADNDADRVILRQALNRTDAILREVIGGGAKLSYTIEWAAGPFRPDGPRLELRLHFMRWSDSLVLKPDEMQDTTAFRERLRKLHWGLLTKTSAGLDESMQIHLDRFSVLYAKQREEELGAHAE